MPSPSMTLAGVKVWIRHARGAVPRVATPPELALREAPGAEEGGWRGGRWLRLIDR
jgi:hypothetical protein